MAALSRNLIIGSGIATALVALAAVLDIALEIPFGRNVTMDIMFLISAGVVGYMAYEAYHDLS